MKCKYDLVSWETWKRKNNPKIGYVPDGVKNIIYSVEPTLYDYGFREINSEFNHNFTKKSKGVAIELLEEWIETSVSPVKIQDWEFVYYRHRGYKPNSFPDAVYVYARVK